MTEPVDVTGNHAFRAPNFGQGDQRGPCPGLNALANHGYISRDGIAGFFEVITAVNQVYGMSVDLVAVLAVMGTVGVGNPLSLHPSFSIGGKSWKASNLIGNLFGLLGTPRGLDGAHNWIESDSSNTRDDLYVTGDASTMNMTLFLEAYNSSDDVILSMDNIGARAAKRFEESISINPYFYYGPYTGMIARNSGYAFTGRILSNHTQQNPLGGHLDKHIFASFYAVYEENGQLVYRKGHEQIPANWYRLPMDYGLVELNMDLVEWFMKYPVLASIGGNLGKVDTFAGVDLHDVTGGILNATSLLEGNNLVCFVLEIVKTFSPNSLSSLFKTLEAPLQLVNKAILDPLLDLSCPAFKDMEMDGTDLLSGLLRKYPGAGRSGFAF
ncbi:hypothetical protein AUEXF2481DRAFT_2094 [Aureobasidium subglaciale EXF-2481]|uniref:Heme haloperoxidase family profile domain-containing protein n=1 Tax=Aureobasidium subglaciale (strain EXF-2481) TaxID=1043005 RepID=A0A074YPS9_AURSE|nr:uncharacterized protein AUEXF2481DRAFT_2094 [Aureobasidium subglaciale EXF-2481]KEQ98114.1 hypothetical protein AUEXF2481DRAFT_2094 [Aureobasidium subglaciale EXF-2481]